METTTATRRGIAIGLAMAMLGMVLWWGIDQRADASAPLVLPAAAIPAQVGDVLPPAFAGGWFAKYDGIDGEAQDDNHDKWIDVLSIDWGVHKPGGGLTGQSRRRSAAVVDDMVITFAYEKAAPKLLEKCFKGEIIPTLEIELTTTFTEVPLTYLRYEMKNVMCTLYEVSGTAGFGRPTVVVGNNFEEVKVTYTEFDEAGNSQGSVETEIKVEKSR